MFKRILKGVLARVPHKEIGWKEINEEFTRYALFESCWCNIYLHRLYAPEWHPDCHDHPWSFVAILLKNGYDEQIGKTVYRRRADSILWRPAETIHNVITPFGVSWSIIFTGPKRRQWGFKSCDV